MASLMLINQDGTTRTLRCEVNIKAINLQMPANSLLSWENRFFQGTYRPTLPGIQLISVGGARVFMETGFVSGHHNVLTVRIESPNVSDFEVALEKTVAYIGGEVSTFNLRPTSQNSFIGGVVNDFRYLQEFFKRSWQSARKKIGMRFVS